MTVETKPPSEAPRFGLLVVTHGGLAFELVQTLEHIVGLLDRVKAISIDWDTSLADARETVRKGIDEVDPGNGVLILTDMFGGTATNLALSFLSDRVEILTGVNLPMMIKSANVRCTSDLRDAAPRIKEQGQRAIATATEYIDPAGGGPGDPA